MADNPNGHSLDEETIQLTAEALAMIEEAEKSFAEGKGQTSDEARAYVRKKGAEWLTQRQLSA